MMRLLLDTRLLLWALGDPAKLPAVARQGILDATNEVLFSAASIWEIAIKTELGRADFGAKPEAIARAAKRLVDQRDAWLNPPEWTARVP
mgnify:CR=1 FL=1